MDGKKGERRSHPRYRTDLWAKEDTGEFLFSYRVANLSLGGMFLSRKLNAGKGDRAVYTFTLWNAAKPEHPSQLTIRGTVVYWKIDKNNPSQTGCGIRFDELDLSQQKAMLDFFESLYEPVRQRA